MSAKTKTKPKSKKCPHCKGKGTVNCILGCLTCGNCNGSGKLPAGYGKDPVGDFVKSVRKCLNK